MPLRSRIWLALALASAAPLAAQPAPEVEGVYQDEVFEVGSTLVLSPSGRFLWVFSYGALDAAAETVAKP